jgi:hypothetical protein
MSLDNSMKSIGTIFIWLILTKALPAEVTIKGIDYVKADSIASVLKGVNFVSPQLHPRKLDLQTVTQAPG